MSDLTETLTAALREYADTGELPTEEPISGETPQIDTDAVTPDESTTEPPAPVDQGEGTAAAPPPEPSPDADTMDLSEFGIGDDTDDGDDGDTAATDLADAVTEAGGDPNEPAPFDVKRFMELSLGRDLTPEDAQQMAQTFAWAQSLTPDQVQRVNQALSGEAPVATAPPAGSAPPAQAPALPPLDLGEYVEPETAKQIEAYVQAAIAASTSPLQEQIEAYQQRALADEQARVRAEQQRIEAEIKGGQDRFSEAHPELSAEELAALEMRVRQSGSIGTLWQMNGGDATKAAQDALEMALMSDEQLRAKAVASMAARERQQQEEDAQRLQDISALSGGGGGSAAPADTMTAGEPDSLEDAIRRFMSQG